MRGNVEMQDPSSIVTQDDEHEQHPERGCRYREKIECDAFCSMVLKKCPLEHDPKATLTRPGKALESMQTII